jgi:PAS domain S-box-containing protein
MSHQKEARLRELAGLLSRRIDELRPTPSRDSVKEAFRAFADSLPSVVWTAGSDGLVTFKSRRYYELFGSDDWASVIHPDDRQHTVDLWTKATELALPYMNVCRMLRRDGSYITVTTSAHPTFDDSGRLSYWIGSAHEVAEVATIRRVA